MDFMSDAGLAQRLDLAEVWSVRFHRLEETARLATRRSPDIVPALLSERGGDWTSIWPPRRGGGAKATAKARASPRHPAVGEPEASAGGPAGADGIAEDASADVLDAPPFEALDDGDDDRRIGDIDRLLAEASDMFAARDSRAEGEDTDGTQLVSAAAAPPPVLSPDAAPAQASALAGAPSSASSSSAAPPPMPPPPAAVVQAGGARKKPRSNPEQGVGYPSGHVAWYASTRNFAAVCCNAQHGRCILTRRGGPDPAAVSTPRRRAGRPLGFLVAWLHAGPQCETKDDHMNFARLDLSLETRRAHREALRTHPGGPGILALERPRDADEPDEPEVLSEYLR